MEEVISALFIILKTLSILCEWMTTTKVKYVFKDEVFLKYCTGAHQFIFELVEKMILQLVISFFIDKSRKN